MKKYLFKKRQSGFTLIELITVIAVLAILAVVAAPNFIDISGDARVNSLKNIAGTITSANKVNKVTQKALSKGVPIAAGITCDAAANALLDGGVPDSPGEYTVQAGTIGAVGTTTTCTLENSVGDTEDFTVDATQ